MDLTSKFQSVNSINTEDMVNLTKFQQKGVAVLKILKIELAL